MREDAWAHLAQGVLSAELAELAELDARSSSQIQRHLRLMQLAAPLVAVLSGALHAYGMALRKRHGKAPYWRQQGWWIGLLMDLLGGLAFSLAAPLMAVELLVPLTAVAQLATAFLCGVCLFQERSTVMQQLGFVLSVTAVVLLGSATFSQRHFHVAAQHGTARFWKLWLKPHFLCVHAFWLGSTALCFLLSSHATSFAVLSAYFDGMQFLFTRTIAAILEVSLKLEHVLLVQLAVGKAFCAIAAIHWQQHALGEEDLTTIGSVLPLLQNLTQASLGVSFFGDQLQLTPSVVLAAASAPVGLYLLAQTPERRASLRRASSTETVARA